MEVDQDEQMSAPFGDALEKSRARKYIAGPNSFIGKWCVSRVILDSRPKQVIVFNGVAEITHDAFDENGEMLLGGSRLETSRRYRLHLSGEQVEVTFPDGRPFFCIKLSAVQRVLHWCGEDVYRGRFIFLSNDEWSEMWNVLGPRKAYRSVTRYTRLNVGQ